MIDFLDSEVETARGAGYRVARGTLGKRFSVPQGKRFVRVPVSVELPNFSEQEVVFLQQAPPNALESAPPAPPETGDKAVWARTRRGVVDPRPWGAFSFSDDARRIFDHGGVFVVFCYPRERPDLVWGEPWGGQIDVAEELTWTTWTLLPALADVSSTTDMGVEIETRSFTGPLADLEAFFADAQYVCSLDAPSYVKTRWVPLACNKYGDTVAAILGPEREGGGWVVLLPQVKDIGACVVALLDSVLPALVPQLFPHTEQTHWLHEPPYELPEVVALHDKVMQVREEARKAEEELGEAIENERTAHEWLYTLLTGTDDALVDAVARAFEELGLKDVRKVDDQEEDRSEGRRREDIQVWGRSPALLVEVKGITGLPREASSLQVTKYLVPRMKQWNRTDVAGLAVINHQRALPALRRENVNTFQDDVLANAEHQGFGLLTTLDLFRLVRNKRRWRWPKDIVDALLYSHGRIEAIPPHYEAVGVVDGFFEKAQVVCLRVTEREFAVGDRLAFLLPIEYWEQEIASIQENDVAVTRAAVGAHVGVKTELSKQQARDGVLVFRVGSESEHSPAPAS